MTSTVFIENENRLPLITPEGNKWLGLEFSRTPEINKRVKQLFQYLNTILGFPNNSEGKKNQSLFNLILRYGYAEVMLDLADLVYVQHERPMVFLNMDNLNRTRLQDTNPPDPNIDLLEMQKPLDNLLQSLADVIKTNSKLFNDPMILEPLAESYSFYLYYTKNFPWEDPLKDMKIPKQKSVLDVATGLAGFSLIHDWPNENPTLVLTDSLAFVVVGLKHYKSLIGKENVDVLKIHFPHLQDLSQKFGFIQVSKFLHHLQRDERKQFLKWTMGHLEIGGNLFIIDTDLEHQILVESKDSNYRNKLMPGYLETLSKIEEKFCHNLVDDVRETGLEVKEFDFHEYYDETDAYSHYPGDDLPIKFLGFEIIAEKVK